MAETDSPQFVMTTQYLKDQSFENPNAPAVFAAISKNAPDLNVTVDVSPSRLQERTFEVVLALRAEAKIEGNTAFLCEIDYAGIATLSEGVSEDEIESVVMVEAPRHLFPFARAIMAGATRDGGFPPLVLSPIDFEQLYRARKEAKTAPQEQAPAEA